MTNAEKFFEAMLILGLVCGSVALIVYSFVKQADEIYSPLKEPKVYQTSPLRFLLSTDSCGAFMMIFFAGAFFSLIIRFANSPSGATRPTYLVLVLLILLFAGIAAQIQYINVNHWKHSKNLTITFDPQSKTVWINKNEKEYVLTSETIGRVEIHSTKSYKMPFEYYQFFLQNGETFSISGKAKGVYPIFEYFKKLPTTQHYTRLPLIS